MKLFRYFGLFLSLWLLSLTGFAETSQQTLMKKRVISDLEHIRASFEVKYAPLRWKEEFAQWNLDQEAQNAKAKVQNCSSPTLKECQIAIRDFFNTAKDYHVGVRFYSTETASLPFLVQSANKRYFVSFVDRGQVSVNQFPFEVGDEILTFDGKPIHEVIQDLRIKEFGTNTFEADQLFAEMTLTHRRGELGTPVPSGSVLITGKKKRSNKPIQAKLNWAYTPEKIQDFAKLGVSLSPTQLEWKQDWTEAVKKSQFFEKLMVAHFWDHSFVGSSLNINKHTLGSRSSYIPSLGPKKWRTGNADIFDAYIFTSPSGKEVGYIRIPHYVGDVEEVEEFGLIMNYFQSRTDALIIDQINNPGGNVYYLYGLASTLTDKPLYAPKHHIALTQEEVYTVLHLFSHLELVKDDVEARAAFGDTLGGYPVDYEFVTLTRKFCQFLVEEWNKGKLYTDPTYLFGIDKIKPHPTFRYTKPVLLVINGLDISGGDFFPAIMQDNERAVLFGTRTSGAGGYVLPNSFPNHSGIRTYSLTGSIAERINGKPIENLGVSPDISYQLTENDLMNNYEDYAQAIVNAVESLISKS